MPRSVVQFDFSGGVNQQTDARHVQPGELTNLVNGQFDKVGSIRKRAGFTALSRATTAGGNWNAGKALATFGDELLMLDGTYLGSYSPAISKWVVKDFACKFGALPRKGIVSGAASQAWTGNAQNYIAPDMAIANGLLVVSWLSAYIPAISGGSDRGEPTLSVIDATSGAQILSSYNIEGVGNAFYLAPRLVTIGTKVAIVYADTAGNLYARTYDASTQTLSARTTIAANLRANASCDYQVTTDGVNLLVVYENNSGASPRLSYTVRTTTLTAVTNGTVGDNAFAGPFVLGTCANAGSSDGWWISFATASGGLVEWWAVRHNATSGTTYTQLDAPFRVSNAMAAGVPIAIGAVKVSTGVAALTLSTTQGGITGGSYVSAWRQVAVGGATSGALRKAPHSIWASKPAALNGRTCAWACYYSGLTPDSAQETAVLVDLLTDDIVTSTLAGRPAAVTLPRIAKRDAVSYALSTTLPGLVANGTQYVTAAGALPAFDQRSLEAITVDTSPKPLAMELGRGLYLSGGMPQLYDGARVIEAAFVTYPEAIQSATHLASTGGLTASSDYRYSIVATFTTAAGEVIRSAPSTPVKVTTGVGENTVRFYLAHLPWTLMGEASGSWVPNVTFEVYRTKAGGSDYYRVPPTKIYDVVSGKNGPLINDPTTHSRQYEDRAADTDLDGQPLLYTQGGILSAVCPPGSQVMAVHQDRLFLADGKDVWFSSKRSARTDGIVPRWNELQRFTVEDGGPITALASVGGFLAVFKRDRVFMVAGDGPDLDGGTGQEFSAPARVSSDVGCIEPRSVVVCPAGTVFQSVSGIYLLTPGGQVQYISGAVQDTLDANPTITAATVHETEFQVRFACSSSGATGVILVWDYFPIDQAPQGRWSVFQVYDSSGAQASSSVVGAVNSRGRYHWLAPNGTTYQETPGTYTDAGTWVTLTVETAWVKLAGLQGFQRIWSIALLGERFTDHDVVCTQKVDFSETVVQTETINVQSSFGLEQVQYTPRIRKCEAIKLAWSDATPSAGTVGTGRALSLTGFALEAKVLPKINRLPSAKRT